MEQAGINMPRPKQSMMSQGSAPDDQPLVVLKRDISGGMNTRQDPQDIDDKQSVLLQNILLENAGSRVLRSGMSRIDSTYPALSSPGWGLFGFNPDGGTFELLAVQKGNIFGWPSSGTFISRKTGFTDGIPMTMIKAGQQAELDIVIFNNGIDDPFAMYQDHTFHDLLSNVNYSMPKTIAMCYYGDRVWTLKNNLSSFSDAFPPTYYPTPAVITGDQSSFTGTLNDKVAVTIDGTLYDNIVIGTAMSIADVIALINDVVPNNVASASVAGYLMITSSTIGTSSNVTIADGSSTAQTVIAKLFFASSKTTNGYAPFDNNVNVFRVPVGTAQALLATRDQGIIFMGRDQIWQLLPSQTPNPTTDQPQKILDIGCMAGATAIQVADDIIFLAPDGVRGLFRTQLDKLQTGQSFPLSYVLAEQVASINWSRINQACAIFFDNKYLISLPVNGSEFNNQVWVYYPALSTAFYASTNTSNMATMRSWAIYEGWNISRFAILNINGAQTLFGIDSVTGKVRELLTGNTDDGNPIIYDEISKAEDFKAPLQFKYGGEFKLRVVGGNGVLVISANADDLGFVQLGTLDLVVSGVSFPTVFPVLFTNLAEVYGGWHLDDAGIVNFKRCEFEIFCDSPNASVTILESVATAFQKEYISEDTYPPYTGPIGAALLGEDGQAVLQENNEKILTE